MRVGPDHDELTAVQILCELGHHRRGLDDNSMLGRHLDLGLACYQLYQGNLHFLALVSMVCHYTRVGAIAQAHLAANSQVLHHHELPTGAFECGVRQIAFDRAPGRRGRSALAGWLHASTCRHDVPTNTWGDTCWLHASTFRQD